MQPNVYFAFIGISLAVLVFPGPSILLIVANSLQRGALAGLYTVAGGIIAMLVQLSVALTGLTSFVSVFAGSLYYVRWLGALYLLYLGVQRWRGARADLVVRSRATRSNRAALGEGFVVALTNPGTLLFFVAFLPQFVNRDAPAAAQLLLLAATFMVLTILVDTSYALLSARIGNRLHDPRWIRVRDRASGTVLILAAIVFAIVGA